MNLYLVAPMLPPDSDQAFIDARLKACIEPIADLILSHIVTDPALFGVRHVNEASVSPLPAGQLYGHAEAVRIPNEEALRHTLMRCGDPSSGEWTLIRSLVTCRSVYYGYDGQAFVCLPDEAKRIISPDPALISVEECSHLLTEVDWMDGIVEH